jgi:putative oxidoreductase
MSIFTSSLWASRMLSVLRIVAALNYMTHGTMKLLHYPPAPPGSPPMNFALLSLPGIAGLLETVGGALLMFGLFTRPVAFLLSGEMAVAYFMVHFPNAFWPATNFGEPAVLYCFIWLYFAFAGAGPWSLDAVIARRQTAKPSL